MDIVDKRGKKFSELKNGDTFIQNGVLYIKTDNSPDINAFAISKDGCSCIYITANDIVTPVRCMITIEA